MAGSVQIAWYANVFRGDKFATALQEIAPLALRYGATDYIVYRSNDDRYKFLHASTFENKADWERYWYGPEFTAWRERYGGWYQIPVLYVWNEVIAQGASEVVEETETADV